MLDEYHDTALVFLEHGAEGRIISLAEPGREVVLHIAVFIYIGFEQQAQSAGERVSALSAEIPTATAIVIPNCV